MWNINIVHRIKTNIIAQNGNINVGNTVHNSHTSNLKVAAASFSFGDCSSAVESQKSTNVIGFDNEGKRGDKD